MTPKDKAYSLIIKFKEVGELRDYLLSDYQAREISIIAVDEIIKSGPSSDTLPDVTSIHYDELKEAVRYWEEVKKELQKL